MERLLKRRGGRGMTYLFPPLFYLAVALAGRRFTASGIASWYPGLEKPLFTPPGWLIGAVWTVIYVLASVSLVLVIRSGRKKPGRDVAPLVLLYLFNGVLNATWSYVFFTAHMLGLSVLWAGAIAATAAFMAVVVWGRSRAASAMLFPYVAWASYATFLSSEIFRLN